MNGSHGWTFVHSLHLVLFLKGEIYPVNLLHKLLFMDALNKFAQLLYYVKWEDRNIFDAAEYNTNDTAYTKSVFLQTLSQDKHLMFILQVSLSVSSNYICITPLKTYEQQCSSHQFQCSNGICIPRAFHCNSISDCMDGSDETDCSWICTHMPCANCLWPHCRCINSFYQCESGGCIPVDAVCDGTKNCADASDELYCDELILLDRHQTLL